MSQNTLHSKLQRLAFGRPVLFSILVIILSSLLTEIPINRLFEPWLDAPAPELLKVILGHTLIGLLLVGLLAKLKMLPEARFNHLREWRAVWLVWPFLVFTLLNLDSLISGSLRIDTSRPELIILFVFTNLAIGFAEEVMGRAVVLNLMLRRWGNTKRGVYLAVMISSLLFGIGHIGNFLSGHLPALSTLTQMGYAIAFGVVFAACFLRNNSIWPIIIMHASVDFAGGLRHISIARSVNNPPANNTLEAALTSLIISMPLLLYGLFILRKVDLGDMSNQQAGTLEHEIPQYYPSR